MQYKVRPGWSVVECFVAGKSPNQNLCEDVVVVTEHYAAVIDGVTDKSGFTYSYDAEEISSGRFAALTLRDLFYELDPNLDPLGAVTKLSAGLDRALNAQRPNIARQERPAAVVVATNFVRDELWRVGDTSYALAGDQLRIKLGSIAVGIAMQQLRCCYLAALDAAGDGWSSQGGSPDPGRAVIQPMLDIQAALANRPESEWGYGVINGIEVPEQFVEIELLQGVGRVVMASDGYPALDQAGTINLRAAELHLAGLLERDSECRSELAGAKAVMPGNSSFDDRAWLELLRD